MRKDLLLALADHMERVKGGTYDQDVIVNTDFSKGNPGWNKTGRSFGHLVEINPPENFCGTVCCVMGHAPLVPEIREAGLFYCTSDDWFGMASRREYSSVPFDIGFEVDGRVIHSFVAAAKVFDISDDHADVLFGSSDNEPTRAFYRARAGGWVRPATVAKRLREYVESDGKMADDVIAAHAHLYAD